MPEFKTLFHEALTTISADTRASEEAIRYDTLLPQLKQENRDKLAALEQIKLWLRQGASDKPILDAKVLAKSHTRYRMYELTLLQGQWWIGRAFRIGFVSNRSLKSIDADAFGQEYLKHISLPDIAEGVARLVIEKGYNSPSFD